MWEVRGREVRKERKMGSMEIKTASVMQRFGQVPQGAPVSRQVSYLKDMREIYKSQDRDMADETVMYEVFRYGPEDDTYPGHLCWGMTVMYPVTVCGEYNMTRGHFHQDLQCAEIYYGMEGRGMLLLMDETGKTWAEKVEAGSVHYIRGIWGHRLINTGEETFKVAACWPASAGHDHGRVEKDPFAYRLYKGDTGIEIKNRRKERDDDRQL